MRLTGGVLRRLIAAELERTLRESRLMFEEEEDADTGSEEADTGDAGDEGDDEGGDAADALFGDTGGGDSGGGSESTGEDDEETPEGEDEEAEDSEEEEEPEEPPEPTGPTGFEFDEEINTAMAGFEEKALNVASAKNEGRIFSIARFLFEAEDEEDPVIDVPTFADDTARLIANYDTLIDMEQAIYTKAVDFMADKYGEDAADELRDILSARYGIDLEHQNDPEADETEVYAAGATGGGGAA